MRRLLPTGWILASVSAALLAGAVPDPTPAAAAVIRSKPLEAVRENLEERADLARQCVLLKRKIEAEFDAIEQRREQLQGEFDRLYEDRKKVDLKDGAAVDAWNKRREQYQEGEFAFNTRVRDFNAQVRKHNQLAQRLIGLGGLPPGFKEPPLEPTADRKDPPPVKPNPDPPRPEPATPGLRNALSRPAAPEASDLKQAPIAGGTILLAFGSYWKVVDSGIDSVRLQPAADPEVNVSLEWREALVGETLEQRVAGRLTRYQERYERVERLPDRTLAGAPATQISYLTRSAGTVREVLSLERQERGVLFRITISAPAAGWSREAGQILRLLDGLRAEGQ